MWDTGLEDRLRIIADKAIDMVADEFLDTSDPDETINEMEIEIDDHMVTLIRNDIIDKDIFLVMWPHCKGTECQLNVYVENEALYINVYQYIDGKWINEKDLKDVGK